MTTLTGTTWYMRQSGSTIQRSTDNATWTTVSSWPVNLGTTNATTLTFVTDLSFNSRTQYFTVGNNNQIIDGSYNTVYINNVNGYPGLVGNGTWLYSSNVLGSAVNSKDTISVKNITLTSVNSSLLAISRNSSTGTASSAKVSSGWICQAYFGNKSSAQTNTCNVSNCNTNGSTTSPSQDYTIYWTKSLRSDIGTATNIYADNTATTAGGCIVGDYSITNVNNCYSTGTIGSYGGGVVGAYAGNYGAISTVTNCFSRGSIGSYGGGIVGSNAGGAIITYCYSTGSIADNAGGIIGNTANSATVTGCYSTGNMSGTSSGGIFGSTAGTTTSITNCYTTGTGPNPLTSSTTSKPTKTKTYTTSGGTWIDASANSALTVSGVWTDISGNSTSVPYRLSLITTTLYNTSSGTNITSQTASLSGSYTWSIGSISVTDAFGSVTSFYEYTGISINSSTGKLTFSNLSGSIYDVNVMIEDANGLYWFQTFTNTVTPMIGYIGSFSGVKKSSPDNSSWSDITWPLTIPYSNTIVYFVTDMSFTAISQYFIIGADNQTIDGDNKLAKISAEGYRGLVRNANYNYLTLKSGSTTVYECKSTGGYSNATVKNVHIVASSNSVGIAAYSNTSASTIKYRGGWLCHIFFIGSIDNCSVNGSMPNTSYWYDSTGTLNNTNTYAVTGGMIVGDYCQATISRCASFLTGNLTYAGAIAGTGLTNSTLTNCFSTATGSTGYLIRYGEGVTCTNCYTLGTTLMAADTNSYAINCYYTTGSGVSTRATNSYAYAGNWNDASANALLITNTNVWTDINLNSTTTPYYLSAFTRDFYSSSSGTNVTTISPVISLSVINQGDTWIWSIVSISVNSGTAVASYSGISINSSTGALSFSGLSAGTYAIKVMAIYNGTQYCFQTFTNTVASTNTAPTITSGATASVSENISTSTTVYTVTATDPDAGTTLTYSISGGSDSALFNINSTTGVVTFKASPNYESPTDSNTDNVYNITVAVSDGTATTTQAVAISVTNVNETATITGTYSGSITETNVTQTVSGTLNVSDPDAGQSSFIARTDVSGNNQYGKFSIGTSGNWSYTMNTAHNEFVAGQTYTDSITVTSNDSTASQVITVTITGTNDIPTISGTYTGSITETNAVQSVTGTLSISDPDNGQSSFVPQTDVSGNNQYGKFSIDVSGNWSYTMNTAHNEFVAGQTYTDSITVTSNDSTASQVITVTITGTNDIPTISGTYTGSITESDVIQSVSGTLSISDPDAGQSAIAPRTDVSGNNQYGKFSIDASGNWSYTMSSAHNEFVSGQTYTDSITVSSTDGSATRVITVILTGSNDVPIITGTYTGSITETDVTQSITGTLYISNDPDSETTYFIQQTDVSGNNRYGKFSIDASGNWSYTMNSPHNEFAAGQTYTDSIMVHSNDGSASQAITVTMTGINDAPIITSGMFERTSNSIGTSTVYTVTAVDPDINASLTYSISGGVDASLFNIDASSGAVSFKTTPSPRVYSFTVGVSDGSLSATQNVVLMVTSSSVANYPLITGNQTSITTSSVIYGDITVSNLNIASGVEIYLASGSTMTALSGTFQGSLSGAGNLMKSGTGELTLSSSNTDFTGVLKVTEGTVKVESADALGSGSVELGTSDSSGNATLKFDFSGPTSITNDIVASSTGENLVENTGLYTLTLSGNVTKDGTTLTLSGDIEVSGTIEGSSANSDVIISGDTGYTSSSTTDYNGPTTIQDGGTLTLENGVSIPNSDVTVESGGLFIIESTSMPSSVTANSVTLESNSIMNLNSGYLKTNTFTISETISGSYASINLVPGNSAIIETGDLTISTMLYINISDALTSGSYDLIEWTGTSVVTGSVIVYYSGVSTVSISGAFNYTSKKYTITVTPTTSSTTYTVGGTISGNSTEVVLKLNGTTDTLTIASGQTDAAFTFSTGLTSGTSYTVTVYSYSSSTQSYVLNYSTGTISSSNISNVSLVFSDVTNPDGNICFPANTPVLTNLGYIPIAKIDPAIHHIRNKKIIAVTKTVTNDKHLVRIGKNALGQHYPSKAVYSSRNHKVFYKGKMIKAKHLVELVENVSLVPYNGEPLYNILLEEHEKMQVNNLIVETLHPEHKVAKLYRILGLLSPAEQVDLIRLYNKYDREYRPVANK